MSILLKMASAPWNSTPLNISFRELKFNESNLEFLICILLNNYTATLLDLHCIGQDTYQSISRQILRISIFPIFGILYAIHVQFEMYPTVE